MNDTKVFELKFNNNEGIGINQIVEVVITEDSITKILVESDDDLLNFFSLIVADAEGNEYFLNNKKDSIKNCNLKKKMFFVLVPKPLKCHIKNNDFKTFEYLDKVITLKIYYAARQDSSLIS